MRPRLIILLFLFAFMACSTDPRPLAYGEDVCHHCKMKLMDPHYGAEVVTDKGKIYVFDDVNCLISFLASKEVSEENIKHLLITDYQHPESLTDAKNAFFLKSEQFKTPMASNVVAFSDQGSMKSMQSKHGGVYMTWGELVTQFK